MDETQAQALADRIADHVLDSQLRPNPLTRYGKGRSGALAEAADLIGTAVAASGVARRLYSRRTDPLGAERLYARSVAVDRDRAHADVYYVDERLRMLAMALVTDDEADELVRAAALVLVAFVAAGRPPDRRLAEVEDALARLREAQDGEQPGSVMEDLMPPYLAAWRRALAR